MTQMHLTDAMLCIQCDRLYDQALSTRCPSCLSEQAMGLWRIVQPLNPNPYPTIRPTKEKEPHGQPEA